MLKTNSKKARENIRSYIMDGFEPESYGIETPETFEEAAKIILDIFREEHFNSENIRRYYHYSEWLSFKAWAAGLPSIIDTCYYYNRSAVDDLGAILEETEEEKAKFTEEQAEEKLTNMIYRELIKAA